MKAVCAGRERGGTGFGLSTGGYRTRCITGSVGKRCRQLDALWKDAVL